MNKSRNFGYDKPGFFLAQRTIIPIGIVVISTSSPCLAQIIPDTTLGNKSSHVINGNSNGIDLIEGGVQSGSNLYHSFREFNVNNGQKVYFANPTGVENIFSRVTGSNPSNILGTLGVNGAANLFLLNPKGIIFGPNAQLDIQGSFLATTANSFVFPDGSEFSATNPQAPQLLTMSVPVGVQFGSQPAASITSEGKLVAGKDLTLNAGNLDLQGTVQGGGNLTLQAQDSLKVRDSKSNAFIAAAGGNLLAQGHLVSSNSSVIRAIGDVSFDNYTGGSLHILAGGSVNIAGDVEITGKDSTNNSLKESVTLSDGTTINIDGSQTPTLDIRAGVDANYIGTPIFTPNLPIGFNPQNPTTTNTPTSANISIQGGIYNTSGYKYNSGNILITNQYHPNGLAGDITTDEILTYGDVTIDSRGDITTNRDIDTSINEFQEKDSTAGSIRLLANQNISMQGDLLSNVNNSLNGNGGNIYLNSRNGNIDIKKDIISKSPKNVIAGSVNIEALGNISLTNSQIEATSNNANRKYNNNITINSTKGSLNLNNSKLNTTNKGSGYAGYIIINARDRISILNESSILSQGSNGLLLIGINLTITTNESGNIKLDVDPNNIFTPQNILIEQKSVINTNSNGSDEAGGIIINASDKISLLNESKIFSQGNNGLILIGSNAMMDVIGLELRGIIDNPQSIIIDKSEINTNTNNNNLEVAGNIIINASDQVSILNGSNISSQGDYGYIDITTGSLFLNQNSAITTNNNSGDAGYIYIKTQNLLLRRQSKISTTGGEGGTRGNGGDITINAKDGFVVAVPSENSDIIANAFRGKGGRIEINANRILGFKKQENLRSEQLKKLGDNRISDISAASDVGDNGEVTLNTLSIDPTQGLVQLPTNLVDTSRLIAQGCGSNSNVAKGKSEFVITGRGGLPPSPDETLKPGAILPEWVVNNTVSNSNNSVNMTERNLKQLSSNNADTLVEAVGMVRSANGDIVFTTQPTTATGLQSGLSSHVCGVVQENVKP